MSGIRLHLPIVNQDRIHGLERLVITPQGASYIISGLWYLPPGGIAANLNLAIQLFRNNVLFDYNTGLDQLTECTFEGYFGPFSGQYFPTSSFYGLGSELSLSPDHIYDVQPGAEDQTIYGAWLSLGSGEPPLAGVSLQHAIHAAVGSLIPMSLLVT